jgi:hypothetical protein
MKRFISILTVTLLIAINGSFLAAQITVSGILDTSVSMRAGAGDAPDFSCGIEEFANIRFQTRLRDRGMIFGAVNLFAAAGDYAFAPASMGFFPGENYVAGIELERLFFRLNFETTDLDCGLLRLPFGYGQVWGSSDFLNPQNPQKPDARPRAVLGAGLSWYPVDEVKLLGFTAAPRNPLSQNGEGWHMGISADRHWSTASVQTLYSFEMPKPGSENGIHRAGLSVKADIEIGFVIDMLYTYNHEAQTRIDGLSFSIGADYSFFEGNLLVLAEYLYNGETSSTAYKHGGSFTNQHYLYSGLTWRFNDFTNAGLALISGLSDASFLPIITFNHELFQGATLTFTVQIPLDRELFSEEEDPGEFGPTRTGSYVNFSTRLRLRF